MTNQMVGERIRYYRKARGLTQQELARTVNRAHPAISNIEAGTRKLHVDELVIFADALDVPPSVLLGEHETDLYAAGFEAGRQATMVAVREALERLTD